MVRSETLASDTSGVAYPRRASRHSSEVSSAVVSTFAPSMCPGSVAVRPAVGV